MVREANEEVGININAKDLEVVHVMHISAHTDYIYFYCAANAWSGELRIGEPEKCDDLSWFPINSLPKNTIPNIKAALDNYNKGIFFSEFAFTEEH